MFGQVFKRSIKSTVEGLRKHFGGSGGEKLLTVHVTAIRLLHIFVLLSTYEMVNTDSKD